MDRPLPREAGLKLYPVQEDGVAHVLASKGRRYVLAYGTGCGKTATALTAIDHFCGREGLADPKVLVVCPAMVRRHWAREAGRWLGVMAHPVEYGRERRLTKRLAAQRDFAYRARWQVVSYDLLGQLPREGYDAIVLDELHHLSNWQSQQSGLARALVGGNPEALVVGLTATLIPTEVKQLWHPLALLFGTREWGRLPRVGDCSWEFARLYCRIETTPYGKRIHGARNEAMPDLQRRLATVSHRVVREDICADLPPLDVKMLDIPGTALDHPVGAHNAATRAAIQWAKDLAGDITHAVVLTYHRKLAQHIAAELGAREPGTVLYIDGTMTTAQRAIVLQMAENMDRCTLVATSESIREGVRLMWAQKVLMAEWRQSPVMVIQVLGRFQSVGDTRRPQVDVLTDESLYSAASTLIERTTAINAVLRAGKVENVVESVFRARDLTESRLAELTQTMFAAHRPRDAAWQEDSDDDNTW